MVDDGSADQTVSLASAHLDAIYQNDKNSGRGATFNRGTELATEDIVAIVCQDEIVQPDTLHKIEKFLEENPDVTAVTGRFSKEHPNPDFWSQYKNLYMYYTMGQSPCDASFVSTIYAFRRSAEIRHREDVWAEDTDFSQQIIESGGKIVFLEDLQVVHLKRYSLLSLVVNDFRIPCSWAQILLRRKAWRRLGRKGTGFAHATRP